MLEPAVESDVAAIVDLVNAAFRGMGARRSWNMEDFIVGPRIDAAAIRGDIAAGDVQLLVHRDPHERHPVATVRIEPGAGGTWLLGLLSVAPERQQERLGRAIMNAAEALVRTQGGRRVRLSVVNRRETLIAWYVRRGYRPTGDTMPFPYDDRRFGTPLRDDLAFVMLEKPV